MKVVKIVNKKIMSNPVIIIADNLILPITATEKRIAEIKNEVKKNVSTVCLNGLFIMLVSYNESMQKEIIKYYLKYRPEKIPEKSITIDKSSIVESEDFYFMENIVEEYINKMPLWKISELFYQVLNIPKPSNINKIKKIVDKRNELIHSNMKIEYKHDDIKYGFVSAEDILDSAKNYEEHLSLIKVEIQSKYSIYSKIKALMNLWYYTFDTPLCANFTDYWYVDEDNDLIKGCKFPDIENILSSSEKFMLDIWRSQVCGSKVNFLNMSSLDKHSQNCLYMFLKLSNDIFMYS